ncbi:MAG: TolC family protein, partial [Porphyromonas asaccharolytica]
MMRDLLTPLRGLLILALSCILSSSLYAQDDALKLSLHDCIRYHQTSPVPSAQLEAQRQAAHATQLKAQSNFFPQISLSGGWLYTPAKLKPFSVDLSSWLPPMQTPNLPGVPTLGEAQSWLDDKMSLELGHVFYGSLSLRQPIFAGGRIYNGVRLARIGERAAEYQWTIQQRSEEEQIAKTYWQAVQLQEQLKAIAQFNDMLDKTLADVSAMKEQGVVADREVVSVRVNRNNAKLQ